MVTNRYSDFGLQKLWPLLPKALCRVPRGVQCDLLFLGRAGKGGHAETRRRYDACLFPCDMRYYGEILNGLLTGTTPETEK